MVLAIRALLFYTGYISSVIIWGPFATLTGLLLPYRARLAYVIGIWAGFVLWWLRITCNIRCKITGKENLEARPRHPFRQTSKHLGCVIHSNACNTTNNCNQEKFALDPVLWMGVLHNAADSH